MPPLSRVYGTPTPRHGKYTAYAVKFLAQCQDASAQPAPIASACRQVSKSVSAPAHSCAYASTKCEAAKGLHHLVVEYCWRVKLVGGAEELPKVGRVEGVGQHVHDDGRVDDDHDNRLNSSRARSSRASRMASTADPVDCLHARSEIEHLEDARGDISRDSTSAGSC